MLPRGTTWSITTSIVAWDNAPINLLGHRLLCTVRTALSLGTADSAAPYVWQGDSAGSGIIIAIPSTTNTWAAGFAVTSSSYTMPSPQNGCFYSVTNAGSGNVGSTAPAWPIVVGQVTLPDSNGVVWTCAGFVNQCTITMPASATQALPNPTHGSLLLLADIVDNDGAGGVWQPEAFGIVMTARVTLGEA